MLNRRSFLTAAAALPLVGAVATPAFAAKSKIYATDGVAINGYDAVAYFTKSKAKKGTKEHVVEWNGAKWKFASAETKAKFEADPEAYAPQYGGYCAYAVSKGGIADTDPHAWTVHDNKLYLNFNKTVMGFWREDIPGNIAKGDANWPGVLSA